MSYNVSGDCHGTPSNGSGRGGSGFVAGTASYSSIEFSAEGTETPPKTSDTDYVSGVGDAGTLASPDGGDGLVVIVWVISNTPLPVELLEFTGAYNAQNHEVELQWQTGLVENVSHLLLEKMDETGNWGTINTTPIELDNTRKNYSFSDQSPIIGNNFYRLKEVSFDGIEKVISQIVTVEVGEVHKDFTLFPNPVHKNELFLNSREADVHTLRIFGVNGQRFYLPYTPSGDKVNIDISKLSKGVYYVEIITLAGKRQIKKFLRL